MGCPRSVEMRYAERRSRRALGCNSQLQVGRSLGISLPHSPACRVRSRNVRHGHRGNSELTDQRAMASTAIPLPVSASKGEVPFLIRVMGFILRIPLVFKILGANAIIAGVVLLLLGSGPRASEEGAIIVVIIALTLAFAVNALLVRVALTPIEELQSVAAAVSN